MSQAADEAGAEDAHMAPRCHAQTEGYQGVQYDAARVLEIIWRRREVGEEPSYPRPTPPYCD